MPDCLPRALGDQNPADQHEAQRLAELPQHVDKIAPERLAFKKLPAPISAAGDELQLPRAETTQIDKPQSCALRQARIDKRGSGEYAASRVRAHHETPSFRVGDNPGTKREVEGFAGRRMNV
jgi:hypothetical protein